MLKVDIADSPELQERGLMFVKEMEADRGMLFVFKRAQHLSFWGRHTYIPLDIAFINAKNEIVKIDSIKPHNLSPVSSQTPCVAAIEANEGFFKNHGVNVGQIINIEMPNSPRLAYQSGAWDGAVIYFKNDNSEGLSAQGENISNRPESRVKQSQLAPQPAQQGQTPVVDKKDSSPVGQPVTDDVNGVNLPVLDISDLGSILEDSFDEEQQISPGQQPEEEQLPPEQEEKYPVFSNAFDSTEWAEKNNEVVRISYTTKHGRALVRDIEPHGKFHSKTTNKEILVTFDETIGDIRAFIVSNISRWAFTGRQFEKKFIVRA